MQLLTATTSWAAYVVDAPMVSGADKRECRFGVRAVLLMVRRVLRLFGQTIRLWYVRQLERCRC